MTDREFESWYAFHVKAFPNLGEWVEKNAGVLRHWCEALRDIDLGDAKAATGALVRGDLDEPKGPAGIPRVIRQYARSKASERRVGDSFRRPIRDQDGNWTYSYRCLACEDTGWRIVVSDTTIDEWRSGNLHDARSHPTGKYRKTMMVVACDCDAGAPRLTAARNVRFDAARHIEWTCLDDMTGSLADRIAEGQHAADANKCWEEFDPNRYQGSFQ